VAIGHADDGLARLLDPVQDLLVFDLQLGVSLCFFTYALAIGGRGVSMADALAAFDLTLALLAKGAPTLKARYK
jgi:hypothetical protein